MSSPSSVTKDNPSDRLPLVESTNYYTTATTPLAATTTPTKLTKNKQLPTALSNQTPPGTASINNNTSPTKRTNQGATFDAFGFNTPLRATHLDPKTILSSINYDLNIFNMQSTYLSPASSSPQHQQQLTQSKPESPLPFIEEPEQENGSPPNKKKRTKSIPSRDEQTETTNVTATASTSTSTSNNNNYNKPFSLYSQEKPPYSYATLIGIAILSQPEKRLTLSNIYQWISDTFKFYKKGDVGWQNSIRHNLSLNKAFVKAEKSKDGKGHYWRIKPGFEEQFLKSRSVKKSSYHEVMDQLNYATKMNEAMAAAAAAADAAATAATTADTASQTSPPTTKDTNTTNNTSKKRKRKQPIMLMSSPTIPCKKASEEAHDLIVSEDNEDYYGEEDITILDPPIKKFKSQRNSSDESEEEEEEEGVEELLLRALGKLKSGNVQLLDLPWASNAPYSESPSKLPPISHLTNSVLSTPSRNSRKASRNDSSNSSSGSGSSTNGGNNIPQFHITESPEHPIYAGKNLTFTSSFSCNSNFELSPMRTSETGPLLEPVTPANNNAKVYGGHPQIAQLAQLQPLLVLLSTHLQHANSIFGSNSKQMFIFTRTPKSTTTPLRRTPTTNSIISYLEEYFSPLNDASHLQLQQPQQQQLLQLLQLLQLHYANNNLHIPALHPLHYIQTPPAASANRGGEASSSTTAGSVLMQLTLLSASTSSSSDSSVSASSHLKLSNVVASSSSSSSDKKKKTSDMNNNELVSVQSSPILKRAFNEKSKSRRLIQELEKLQREL